MLSRFLSLFYLSSDEGEDLDQIFGGKVDPNKKSSNQIRKERLAKKITDLEEQSLAKQTWQLEGEIDKNSRPENSLLKEVVDFDSLAKSVPKITNEFTLELEEIIKSRIKDNLYDDVEYKELPNESADTFKKQLVLNSQKSKLSLAEIYEQDFLKATGNIDEHDPKKLEKDTIKNLMSSLFNKIDALSNYTFVPRPAAPDIQMVSNLPAINTEEIGNNNIQVENLMSVTSNLAPEEISNKNKSESGKYGLKSNEELDKTERNKIRRDHKKFLKVKSDIEKNKIAKYGKINRSVNLKNRSKNQNASSQSQGHQVDNDGHKNSGKLTSTNFFKKFEDEKINGKNRKNLKRKMMSEERKNRVEKLKL